MADNQSGKFASAELPTADAESSVIRNFFPLMAPRGSVKAGVGVAYFMK